MNDELQRLRRAAKELIASDRALAGDWLAPGVELPAPTAAPADPNVVADKAAQLAAIDTGEVRGCTLCGLSAARTNAVFGEGDPDADLMFIGEGPGAEEDKQGRPFVGRAGELLTKMINAMGLRRQDVYIANVVKCRPPGNRAPGAEEVHACWDYLVRQLRIIGPKVIVTLGNPATHAILDTKTGITRMRGQWRALPMDDPGLEGIKVMPTFHPAFVLRQYNADTRGKVWSDLREVMAELGLSEG